jgi:hypothetical protein
LHKRVRIRPRLSRQQLGQAGNAGSDAPRLIAREQTGSRAPAGLVLEINVGERRAVVVRNNEDCLVDFFNVPRSRKRRRGSGMTPTLCGDDLGDQGGKGTGVCRRRWQR